MRADAVGCNRIEQERVAVGLRLGDARGRDGAAGTAAIDDDDRLSERLVQLGADVRARKSAAPPGGTGTISETGRVG